MLKEIASSLLWSLMSQAWENSKNPRAINAKKEQHLKSLYTPTSQKEFVLSEVYLIRIFHGSTKLQTRLLDCWIIGFKPFLLDHRAPLFLTQNLRHFCTDHPFSMCTQHVTSSRYYDQLVVSVKKKKKCCLTNYNTSHATFSPKGESAQHLSCHDFSFGRVVSAYRPFFLMVKFFWSCLHSPEWGPAQCKMSYSHCADQHALWALMCP